MFHGLIIPKECNIVLDFFMHNNAIVSKTIIFRSEVQKHRIQVMLECLAKCR